MSRAIGVSLFALLVATSAQAQQVGDVFYIALENHNFTQPSTVPAGTPQQLFGNTAAPYLNSLVTAGNPNAANVSFAGNYQNVSPNQHPSEPNYVYQVAGLTGPLNDSDPYPNTNPNATINVRPPPTNQLDTAGSSMPPSGWPSSRNTTMPVTTASAPPSSRRPSAWPVSQ